MQIPVNSWNELLNHAKEYKNIYINDQLIGVEIIQDDMLQEEVLKLECTIEDYITKIARINFEKRMFDIKAFVV
jgi:hypothetical protein